MHRNLLLRFRIRTLFESFQDVKNKAQKDSADVDPFLFWTASKWLTSLRLAGPTVLTATSMKSSRWLSTRSPRSRSLHRASVVTTESNRVLVDSQSPSWERRPRPPRSWSFVWSAAHASTDFKSPSRGPSTSSWEVTRRGRDRWSSFKDFLAFLCQKKLFLVLFSLFRHPCSNKNKSET